MLDKKYRRTYSRGDSYTFWADDDEHAIKQCDSKLGHTIGVFPHETVKLTREDDGAKIAQWVATGNNFSFGEVRRSAVSR